MMRRIVVLVAIAILAASCDRGPHLGPRVSIELTAPVDIEARTALGRAIVSDLNDPRLRQLVQKRVPDASRAAIAAVGLGLSTQSDASGRVTQMALECRLYGQSSDFDQRVLEACLEETREALKRARGKV